MQQSAFCLRSENLPKLAEKILAEFKAIEYWDKNANIKVTDMILTITTHRLIFQLSKNKTFSFCVNFDVVSGLESKHSGFFSKKLSQIIVGVVQNTASNQIIIQGEDLPNVLGKLEDAFSKKEWRKLPEKQEPLNKQAPIAPKSIHTGLNSLIKAEEEKLGEKSAVVGNSFNNINVLFHNVSELRDISNFLVNNISIYDESAEKRDTDKILQGIGFFSIITKDEAGDQYYNELAKQIQQLCLDVFDKVGGIISLIDVYYFYNKKRQTSLVSPEEILKACGLFPQIGAPLKLITMPNGVKLIESTKFDPKADFDKNIAQHLESKNGITAEQLSKKLSLSVLILRVKLSMFLKEGLICIDDRIEGVRYFPNLLMKK